MGRFVKREIKENKDPSWEGPVYIVTGDKPSPRLIIDDIEGCLYTHIATEMVGEIYSREELA